MRLLTLVLVFLCLLSLVTCDKTRPPTGDKKVPAQPGLNEGEGYEPDEKIIWDVQEKRADSEMTDDDDSGIIVYIRRDDDKHKREVLEDEEGRIIKESLYIQDVLVAYTEYYKNGSIKIEMEYSKGKSAGSKLYYPDGKKKQKWTIKSDQTKIGQSWNEAGRLIEEDILDIDGKYMFSKRWYDDGTLKYEATFLNGEPQLRTWYKPDGSVEKKARGRRG